MEWSKEKELVKTLAIGQVIVFDDDPSCGCWWIVDCMDRNNIYVRAHPESPKKFKGPPISKGPFKGLYETTLPAHLRILTNDTPLTEQLTKLRQELDKLS